MRSMFEDISLFIAYQHTFINSKPGNKCVMCLCVGEYDIVHQLYYKHSYQIWVNTILDMTRALIQCVTISYWFLI